MDEWKQATDALAYYADPSTWAGVVAVVDPPCGMILQDMQGDAEKAPGMLAAAALKVADPATEAGQVMLIQTLVFYAHPGTWIGVAFMDEDGSLDEDRGWTVAGKQLGDKARAAIDAMFEADSVAAGEKYVAIDWTEEALEVENLPALLAAVDVSFPNLG